MRKFFFVVVIITAFLFLFKVTVKAQYSEISVPGINCGIAGDIKSNKCCAPSTIDLFTPSDIGGPFAVLNNWFIYGVKSLLNKVAEPLLGLQKKVNVPCQVGKVTPEGVDPSDINCRCELEATPTPGPIRALTEFCDNQTQSGDKAACTTCIQGGGVYTGMGCVQGSLDKFISQTLFGWGVGLAGGMSLLCIIYAAFMMQSSQGNPEKLKKAQELITSCIMGLMLIIFSVFILKLIGVNILRIPGFN